MNRYIAILFALVLPVLALNTAQAQQIAPTPGAIDPDSDKHEFNRGESIYAPPAADKILGLVGSNTDAREQLAKLVVDYQALTDKKKRGVATKSEVRSLALRKVQFYADRNITFQMLKIPTSKASAYIGFWKGFWARVDAFEATNPVSLGNPGPFKLPKEERLSTLRKGAEDLIHELASLTQVQEALASDWSDMVTAAEYPVCSRNYTINAIPLLKCNPYDEDYFYYQTIMFLNNRTRESASDVTAPIYSAHWQHFESSYRCGLSSTVSGRLELQGSIWMESQLIISHCGSTTGDVADEMTKRVETKYNRQGKITKSELLTGVYCIDSKTEGAKRYHEGYDHKSYKLKDANGAWKEPDSWECGAN